MTTLEDALAKLREGKLDEGRRMLEKLLGRDPSSPVILYNLGMCYSELGILDKSAKALRRCVELDPENANAYTALGVTYTRLGRYEEAAEELRIALRIDPQNFYAMRNLGAVYCEMGEIDAGVRYLEEADRTFPDKPDVLYGLALAYERKGQAEEAVATYRKVAALGGSDPIAEQAKRALTRIATQSLKAHGPRMDAVMYCLGALQRFESMSIDEVRAITYEIAMLGRGGLDINNPEAKYTLRSMEGQFSGLHLLCYMYVGFRQIDPTVDIGTDLAAEYEAAEAMFRSQSGED